MKKLRYFGSLNLLLLIVGCQIGIEREAQAKAEQFWNTKITKCGDSYFTRLDEEIIELKGVNYELLTQPISQSDKLNGIEFNGTTILTATSRRVYSRNQWGAWGEGPKYKDEMGIYWPYKSVIASVMKKNGQWAVEPAWMTSSMLLTTISCDSVPNR